MRMILKKRVKTFTSILENIFLRILAGEKKIFAYIKGGH